MVAAQLLMTFLDVSVPQRSPYVSNTSELFVEMVLSHPEQEFCLALVARKIINYTLCYFYIMVSLWFPHLRMSLCFWNYLMGTFPVSDIVKVVLLFFGTAFPCYCQNISVTPVLRVYSEYSLYVLPWLSLGGEIFPVTCARPDHTDSDVCLCEGHSDLRPWFASQAVC